MTDINRRRITGLFFILIPVIFTACFSALQVVFEYPDILRQPTADVLAKFQAGGAGLIAIWYVFALSAFLFIPGVILMHQVLADHPAQDVLRLSTGFGITAGIVQTFGLIRWVFLVPHLAQTYLSSASSEAQRAAAEMVFEAFHIYAGVAIGEHLGYLTTALWTLLLCAVLMRSPFIPRWFAVAGMILAVGIALGLFEMVGLPMAGAINAISYMIWSLWLIVLGIRVFMASPQAAPLRPAMAAQA